MTSNNPISIEEQLYVLLHKAEDQLAYHNYSYSESLLHQARQLLPQSTEIGAKLHHNDIAARLALAKGEPQDALVWMEESLGLTKDPLALSRTSFMAAQCLFQIKGREKEVIKYCDDAVSYAETVDGQDSFKTEPMRMRAIIAFEKGDNDSAIQYISECLRYAESANLPVEKAVAFSLRSKVFERQGNLQLALDDLYRAERYVKENHDYNHYCRIAIQRLALMYKMGYDEQAKEAAIAIAKDKDVQRI